MEGVKSVVINTLECRRNALEKEEKDKGDITVFNALFLKASVYIFIYLFNCQGGSE